MAEDEREEEHCAEFPACVNKTYLMLYHNDF